MKPGILQLVERVLKWFVPGVLVAAGVAFLIWTFGAWIVVGEPNFSRAVFATLAVLVMGYPCALGMATPLAMIRGGGLAACKGILMRSGEAFQVFKDVKKVVLDKTGTLTKGKPQVVKIVPTGHFTEAGLLALAAAAEAPSEHPLARAIVERAGNEPLLETKDYEAMPGRGVRVTVEEKTVLIGSPRFLSEEAVEMSELESDLEALEQSGRTVVALAESGKLAGLIAIADTLKDDAKEAVDRMKAAGLEPIMITGDNRRTAKAVASQVGISEVMSEVLPEQKAEHVREIQQHGYRVAMVGDGINDAPALMQADVGIAIGAGTDIAIESADIVLVGNRLGGVVDAYYIAGSSYRKTIQNVLLAFGFNGIGVPAAVTGLVHPVLAMVAMAGSVTAVLLNSFGGRLIPKKRKKAVEQEEKVVIRVPTIHCSGCVNNVQRALNAKRGVNHVEGDPQTKEFTISYLEHEIDEEEIRESIVHMGHQVA